jgi:hypothetical protein
MTALVPYSPALPVRAPRRVSRLIRGGRLGALGAGVAPPVGAGSGAGAEIGASQGASIGSAIVPGIGTAIGAVVGAIGGAIAGAINKTDPENVDFNEAVALWQQNPNAIYSLGNPYLALAGLFDLNITTNIPIYRKFGHMGEVNFVVWLCNLVYQAAQQGRIGPNDTALTVMSNIVQPAINAWGYGAMSDPHADLINRLIVTMILQYTEGLQGNWYAVGGDYPTQFNSIPPFSLKSAPAQPAAGATQVTATTCQASTNMPPRPANGSTANGATITPSSGTWIGDGAGEWFFGPDVIPGGNAFYLYTNQTDWVGAAGVQATVVNGQVYLQNSAGQWLTYNGVNWVNVPSVPALNTATTATNAAVAATGTPQPPALPTTVATSDGTQVTKPGTALETSAGSLLYLGPQASGDPNNQYGYPLWESTAGGAPVHNGYLAGMLLLNGGQVYGVNGVGTWYQFVNNNWTTIPKAPTLTTAATTSQVGSQQATQACTPATTSGGTNTATVPVTNQTTGAVVGTTTNGTAITDADIQSLINQMSSQNATAQQTYAAVIQALEANGASVTTGLQNQVAAQVQASVPAASASSGSDLGEYLVIGGLALAGVLFFMNRRRA